MKRNVDIYREMFLKDLSVGDRLTVEQAVQSLEANWKMAEERTVDSSWSPEQRASRRIWAGIGSLVFGRVMHLVDVVSEIAQYPEAATYKIARPYIIAIEKLVPIPFGLSLQNQPLDVLAWLEANRRQLNWNEDAGCVILSPSSLAHVVPEVGTEPTHVPPRKSLLALDFASWADSQFLQALVKMCSDQSLKILVPDVALYDLGRHTSAYDKWLEMMGRLRGAADLVYAGHGVGTMIKEEVATGKPIQSVVDPDVSSRFRLLLTGLNGGDDRIARSVFDQMSQVVADEVVIRKHPELNRTVVAALEQQWSESLLPTDVELLKRGDEEVFVRVMSDWETTAVVFQAAKNEGCTDDTALVLTFGSSAYCHLVFGLMAVALDGLCKSNNNNPAADEETDPVCKLDYLCSAALCSTFPTRDAGLRHLYKLLHQAATRRNKMVHDLIGSHQRVDGEPRLVRLVQTPRLKVPCKLAA
jgi:hypothetical protein